MGAGLYDGTEGGIHMNIRYESGMFGALLSRSSILNQKSKNMEKLASGYRINRAADNAAGLSLSEGMRRLINGAEQSRLNAQDGISLLQTAEGAMHEMSDMLQRMNELVIRAANGTCASAERKSLQGEIEHLVKELDRIGCNTRFNSRSLLDGTIALRDTKTTGNPVMHFSFHTVSESGGTTALSLTGAAWEDDLINQIVPGAVEKILSSFPVLGQVAAKGGLSNEIGLRIYDNPKEKILAYVNLSYRDAVTFPVQQIDKGSIMLTLGVNKGYLDFESDGRLTEKKRLQLEGTILHEMTHAFMFDSVINGMVGMDSDGKKVDNGRFPTWFYEGMAQTMWGAGDNTNDFLAFMGLTENTEVEEIQNILSDYENSIGSPGYGNHMPAQYGTGYLACMYLGYLAAGKPADYTTGDIAGGLNTMLSKIIGGYSLDRMINEVSGGKFTSNMDYQEKFSKDNEIAAFIRGLLQKIGSKGNGSVAGSSFSDYDLLEDRDYGITYYKVDTQNEAPLSSANGNRDWGTGLHTQEGSNYTGSTSPPDQPDPPITPPHQSGDAKKEGGLHLYVGEDMVFGIDDVRAAALGIDRVSAATQEDCQRSIGYIEEAMTRLCTVRSSVGAGMNRLEHAVSNLASIAENTQAAESRIRDTDMAKEMMTYWTGNILENASMAILSQASRNRRNILLLL